MRPVPIPCLLFTLALLVSACSADSDSPVTASAPTAVAVDEAADPTAPAVDDDTPTVQPQDEGLVAVVNGTVIDGTGADPIIDGVVVIDDGSIVTIGPSSMTTIPPGARIVDAAGGTVLPGLIDTHTHNLQPLDPENIAVEDTLTGLYLTGPLSRGVTTYRDAGSTYGDTKDLAALRAAIEALGASTPTVTLTGPIITVEGNGALRFGQAMTVAGPADAADAVDRLADAGVDQIKIVVDDWSARGAPTPTLSPETISAITDAAHERGLAVIAHAPGVDFARQALELGADELTHWPGSEPLPEDLVTTLAADQVPVGTTFGIIRPADGDLRRLLDAGGMIVLSTDAPGVMSPMAPHIELSRMVTLGMTPMEAIVASTAHAAVALGLEDRIGTLEPGKAADILVVGDDPLESISAIQQVIAVIKDGEVVVAPDVEQS